MNSIIQKPYEDNATGKINDDHFATMPMSLENEQENLKVSISELERELENAQIPTKSLHHFIGKAQKVMHFTELTPEIIHEIYTERL